jgi:predicted O-linked N-acetylglucosamine transferase (SPINDLY family)
LSHDPKRFEVFCYSEFDGEDETTIRLSRGVERWQTTSTYSDRDLALKVQADAIDILIDLAGHTAGNRLPAFAYRPAPVQVSFLGYPNTTGLAAIDYYLTDSVRDPADQDTLFVEKLIRLPNGSCCYRPSPKAPDLANPPVERNGYITFGSTHRIEKITTRAVGLWSHILQAVPNSRLLLYRDSLGASEWLRSRLTKLLLTAGIDQTRFEFAWPRGEPHLEAYHRMDLLLEVFPWGSGTTAYECLWMGVPLVAYLGDRSACRGAASALSHMRLPELISATESDYVSKVIELAMDLRRLAELRHSLRERMRLTVCDHVRFTRELEAAYLHMWHAYVATDR